VKSKLLTLVPLMLATTLSCYAGERLLPAGSLIQCTISEPKLSSKTTAIGDPILCRISPGSKYGQFNIPYDSYLAGEFEDYKDPGHLVGKGWMELEFDRMIVQPATSLPLAAKVVDVPGYTVDQQGRILGKGHTTRDIVEWSIPILWPIDLLNLPRRGPRPTLKTETRLTVKLMQDIMIPEAEQPQRDPSGLIRRTPAAYEPPPQQAPPNTEAQAYPRPGVTVLAEEVVPPPPPVYYGYPPYGYMVYGYGAGVPAVRGYAVRGYLAPGYAVRGFPAQPWRVARPAALPGGWGIPFSSLILSLSFERNTGKGAASAVLFPEVLSASLYRERLHLVADIPED
jgi:hypothetical protein